MQIKQKENDLALKYYLKAVKSLDKLEWEERQFALVRGVLAGNVFDWGAKAVSEYVKYKHFTLYTAFFIGCFTLGTYLSTSMLLNYELPFPLATKPQ